MNTGQRGRRPANWFAFFSVLLALLFSAGLETQAGDTINLAGKWKFRRDDNKAGLREKWFAGPLASNATIKLPGTMDEAKLGISNPRKPSLDDLWRPNVYEGAAWYQREIEIPESCSLVHFARVSECSRDFVTGKTRLCGMRGKIWRIFDKKARAAGAESGV